MMLRGFSRGAFFFVSVFLFQEVVFMARRGKMGHGYSKKVFRAGAQRVHRKNGLSQGMPMRGGIRL